MKRTRELLMMLVAVAMMVTLFCVPVIAEEKDIYTCQLYSTVTDAGEVVSKMIINFGEGKEVSNVDVNTFKVHAIASTEAFRNANPVYNMSGDYEIDRQIEKVEVSGSQVIIYFNENEGATLSYLYGYDADTNTYNTVIGRNYPADLTYTVEQIQPLTLNTVDTDKSILSSDENYFGSYICDASQLINDETTQFKAVQDKINYQFHEGSNDTLIVWFHGNGEGDIASSGNNVAQMLANRGTVAWTTDNAQNIFGNAYVMAFQAPDSWYYAQRDNLLEIAYDEIQTVVEKYNIDPEKIIVSGCSAGGYMTTRMIIAYPNLFTAAMINCPALDVASDRGGTTPTDDELASIKDSKTAIWLMQADADTTVQTADCSVRLFEALTGVNVLADASGIQFTTIKQELYSDFTTYETDDGKYKISLYDTNENGQLEFAEDYNFDGINELVEYSNHWSWIYTLINNPKSADNTNIWQWAASYLQKDVKEDNLTTIPSKTETKTEDSTTMSPVQTGDKSLIAIYGLLFIIASGGFIVVKRKFN